MTFEELRIKLRGDPPREIFEFGSDDVVGQSSDIPLLPVEVLDSLPGLEITDTGFPGCFRFTVPIAEGMATYTGVIEIGRNPKKHGKGNLSWSLDPEDQQ